ncbi:hypothetical protein BDY17DRAFT_43220 [Neohortaea acidophila]|uniref:Zn(2)-C6 fungal-type domain-containing protein n=1 Tax=Neohortaea acidophila TaxID=245834 RepID=A0A6A6PIY8_9PEZI|nr:uncharacterized protein BDY17DRAFT_43220 [Neohortaea acidophila]KAF2479681.1 hypothetical protein BDY17DRAFT_43220 [Neohortaea acidophila]
MWSHITDAWQIRCSGFDTSEDGRCTNCARFSQECIFTPVSAQTQAFVPAHTVWRGQNPPQGAPQLYGAYGQPLPQHGDRNNPYPPPQQPGQYPPPPQGYQQPPMYGQSPQQGQAQTGQKRGTEEPHTPTLPPPNPGAQAQIGYGYPDPNGASPSFLPPPISFQCAHAYDHTNPAWPLASTYPYEASRASSSPQKLVQELQQRETEWQWASPNLRPSGNDPRQSIKTEQPVGSVAAPVPSNVKQEERTSTDTSMVHALNRGR